MDTSKFNVKEFVCGDNDVYRVDVKEDVESKDWLNLFEETFSSDRKTNVFRFLIDNRFVSDNIEIQGFYMLGKLCEKYDVKEFIVGVLTNDEGIEFVKDLFIEIAEMKDLNFKCEVFYHESAVIEWLSN